MLVRAANTGIIYSKRIIFNKIKKRGALIQLSNVKSSCGPNLLNSFGSVRSKIQNYWGLASSIDPSQVICGVVSTHNEANGRCLGLVLMQGMRRYFHKLLLIDLKSLLILVEVNMVDRNFLGRVSSLVVDKVCEVLQPHTTLNAYELKLYVEKMRQEGTAVIVLFDKLETKQNDLMLLAGSMDRIFIGVKRKKTTKNHMEMIDEIFSKCENQGAIAYC